MSRKKTIKYFHVRSVDAVTIPLQIFIGF